MVNLLAENISKTFSCENYSSKQSKKEKKRKPMNFASDNSEDHNLPFSLTELKQALQKSKDSATGLDGVHYQLLTHLPDKTLCLLLHVYNKIWESGSFPSWWREAAIIPIPKHGIDTSNPRKYRPVALTNCLVKRWNEWSMLAWCGLWSHRVFCLRASLASEKRKEKKTHNT